MLLPLHPKNPNPRDLNKVIEVLNRDGVIIIPTDTIYAAACRVDSKKGIERLSKVMGKRPEKVFYSILCADLSKISEVTAPIDKQVFRLLRNHLPGPFTFILNANNKVQKLFVGNRKTIGIRIPDHPIALSILNELGTELVVSTIHHEDEIMEYMTEPEEIHDKFEHTVDLVVDGGAGGNIPSTIIDCSGDEPVVVREGKGTVRNS